MKWSPNGMKPSGEWFLEQTQSRRLGVDVKKQSRRPRGSRVRPRGVGAPPPLWAPRGSPDRLLSPIYIHIPRKHLGAPWIGSSAAASLCSHQKPLGSPSRHPVGGGAITGGHLHHPGALHDEEGVVHPRGWGYVPVAMCLISLSLSLSLVFSLVFPLWHDLDVSRALLLLDLMTFLPLYSLVMDWVSLWSYLIGLGLLWEHLMYVLSCLSVVTMGYHVPLDICFGDQLAGSAHEPMHRGWHTFLTLR